MSTTWGPTDVNDKGYEYAGDWDTENDYTGNLGGAVIHGTHSFLYNSTTIPKSATINHVWFHAHPNAGYQLNFSVRLQSGNWATWSDTNKPTSATWGVNNSAIDTLFTFNEACFGSGETREIDLAADLAAAIDADAGDQLESGDYINICLLSEETTSDVYTVFSTEHAPTLTIEWTAAAGGGLAGSITSVCSVPAFLPYIYHTLVDDDVDATGALSDTLPEVHHYLVDDDIDGQSLLKDTLPEVHHYLVNDVVAGQSSVGNLLPYIYHTLVNSVVAAAGGISSLLPYIYHTLVNSVTAGVSTLIGNLITLAGGIEWALSGAITGTGELVSRLPYIYHNMVNNVVSGVGTIGDQLGYLYHYLTNNIVSGASTLWGNLTYFTTSVGSRLRVYMRIGKGRF